MKSKIQGKDYYKELKDLIKTCSCKFTNVFVTAIIVTDKGVFGAGNYENIIPTLSMCAERMAIYQGIRRGITKIYEVHILSSATKINMCGVCRQFVSTFATPNTMVYVYDLPSGKRKSYKFGQLLPKPALI